MKALKYLAVISIGVVLFTAGALAVLASLDANRYKGFLSRQAGQYLGRPVDIQGELSLSFYPYLDINAGSISIGNPNGFNGDTFAVIDRFHIRAHTLSLLKKEIRMDHPVRINGAEINLVKNKSGNGNWERWGALETPRDEALPEEQGVTAPKSSAPEPPAPETGLVKKEISGKPPESPSVRDTGRSATGAGVLPGLLRAGADIRNVNIAFHDEADGSRYGISGLGVRSGAPAPGKATAVALDCRVNIAPGGKKVHLSGPVALHADILPETAGNRILLSPVRGSADLEVRDEAAGAVTRTLDLSLSAVAAVDPAQGRLVVDSFHMTGPDTRINGKMTVDRPSAGSLGLDLSLDIQGKDMSHWMDLVPADAALDVARAGIPGDFGISGKVRMLPGQNTVDVKDLDIRVAGAVLNGGFLAQRGHAGIASVAGSVQASGPDLSAVVRLLSGIAGTGRAVSTALSALDGLPDKRFDLDTTFDIDLGAGRIEVDTLKAKGLGMTIDSRISGVGMFSLMPGVKVWIDAGGNDLPLVLSLAEGITGRTGLSRWGTAAPETSFRINTEIDLDMAQGTARIPTLNIRGLGLSMAGRLDASGMGTKNAVMDGAFDLEAKEAGWLFRAMGQEKPVALVRSVSMNTTLSGSQGRVVLSPLQIKAGMAGKHAKAFPGGIVVNAPLEIDLAGREWSAGNISVNGLGLSLKGGIRVTEGPDGPGFTGHADLDMKNLRTVMAALGTPLPATADPGVLSAAELETAFSGNTGHLMLEKTVGRLDDTRFQGHFTLDKEQGQHPAVDMVLAVDRLNLDRYKVVPDRATGKKGPEKTARAGKRKRNASKTSSSGTPAKTAQKAEGIAILPLEMIRALDLKAAIEAGAMVVSNIRLSEVKARVSAQKGNVVLSPVSARLYGGTYAGDMTLDASGTVPELALEALLAGVGVGPMLKDTTGRATVKGTGDVTASLSTRGNTETALTENLNGRIRFELNDGAVAGFNLGRFLRRLKSLRDSGSFQASDQEETDFTRLTGTPTVANGIVTLSDLDGKSPGLRISGKGVLADLNNRTMNYTALATVVETSKGQAGKELDDLAGITIPVSVTGPLAHLKIRPDISAALSELAAKELTRTLTDKLGIQPAGPEPGTPANQDPAEALKENLQRELNNVLRGLFD